MGNIRIYSDGLCDPNPNGSAVWAFVVFDGEKQIHAEQGAVSGDRTSNNLADYTALENALLYVEKNLPDAKVSVYVDSRLVLQQARGKWGAEAKHLIPFRNRCQSLYRENRGVRLYYCRPEENRADPLTHEIYRALTGAEAADRHYPRRRARAGAEAN
jgi:ribonuclease HI